MRIVLSCAYTEFSRPAHSGSDDNVKESSSNDSGLVLGEVNPLEVGMPCRLIFTSQLRIIIAWYHILPNVICKVPNSNQYISTFCPLKVVFCEEAFRAGLRILLHLFITLFLQRYGFVLA